MVQLPNHMPAHHSNEVPRNMTWSHHEMGLDCHQVIGHCARDSCLHGGRKKLEEQNIFGQLALTMTHNYMWDPGTHSHAWTTDAASRGASKTEDQQTTCFTGAQHLGRGCCHNPFPMLSPIHFSIPWLHWSYLTNTSRNH